MEAAVPIPSAHVYAGLVILRLIFHANHRQAEEGGQEQASPTCAYSTTLHPYGDKGMERISDVSHCNGCTA